MEPTTENAEQFEIKVGGFQLKELKKIGEYVASSLITKALESQIDDWNVNNNVDHLVGELARCMTLQNAYLDREEYEKCALMKIRIQEIKQKLGIPPDDIPEENDET